MNSPLDLELVNMDSAPEWRSAVRAHVAQMIRTCPDISGVHVTLSGPSDGHHLYNPTQIRLHVSVPGAALDGSADQTPGEGVETTVMRAFATPLRQLEDRILAERKVSAAIT